MYENRRYRNRANCEIYETRKEGREMAVKRNYNRPNM